MHLHLRRIPATLVAAVVLAAAGAESAAASPFGPQSPLAALPGGADSAERPAIAAGDDRSLVVWRQRLGETWSIGGRFVDGAGATVGDAFTIGTTDFGRPSRPDVTYNAARDEFLVAWRAYDGKLARLFAQRVSADGALLGEVVPVVETADDVTEVARVAWASDVDQYLVVWDEDANLSRGCCTFGEAVFGLRLSGEDATPFPVEVPLELSPQVVAEDSPDVAYDAKAGRWLVAFTGLVDEVDQEARSFYDTDVLATTVTPADVVDGPKAISSDEGLDVSRPAVAANTVDGGFAVTWSRRALLTRQSFPGEIVARLVAADGTPAGEQVEVSSPTDAPLAASPGIAHDGNANQFLVVWWSEASQSGPDEAVGRLFDAALAPLGEQQVLSVLETPGERGLPVASAARQPVVGYDRSTCTFLSAYELAGASTNVASRAFDAPDCPVPPVTGVLSNRDSTVRGVETATGSAASLLPRRCTSRRVFSIRLVSRRGRRYRSATVTLDGKLVKRLTGDRGDALIVLEGLPAGTFTVRLTAKLADGRTLRYSRRYRTCARKLKASNRLHRKEAV